MAQKREALRALQNRLAERMQAARGDQRNAAWLAVEVAGHGFLVPLAQAGEIFAVGELLPLAHTRPWFAGVANLRGGLHGVVDLAVFFGLRAASAGDGPGRDAARLLALNAGLGALCALRIDRLAGLRSVDQMSLQPPAPGHRPGFAKAVWRDAQGRPWQELDLAALAAHEQFLAIAA
jgi:twitching motility protein PilI